MKHPRLRAELKKARLNGYLTYMDYISNEQILTWARDERIRCYILNPSDGTKGDRDVILKGDCRVFIEAVNNLSYMADLNLGLFQDDIDQLYLDFMEMINEEVELGSLGIMENDQQVR
jgi:hypothetical protein